MRILEDNERRRFNIAERDLKRVMGGLLVQDRDIDLEDRSEMEVVTERKPTEPEWGEMLFAWKVCKHVRSNAIVLAKDLASVGIGAGQMSRVDSVRLAIDKARAAGTDLTGAALASDAFFPFSDGPQLAVDAGVTAIIQPGGSKRDHEVVEAADAAGISMVFTHRRHFKHGSGPGSGPRLARRQARAAGAVGEPPDDDATGSSLRRPRRTVASSSESSRCPGRGGPLLRPQARLPRVGRRRRRLTGERGGADGSGALQREVLAIAPPSEAPRRWKRRARGRRRGAGVSAPCRDLVRAVGVRVARCRGCEGSCGGGGVRRRPAGAPRRGGRPPPMSGHSERARRRPCSSSATPVPRQRGVASATRVSRARAVQRADPDRVRVSTRPRSTAARPSSGVR